MPLELVGPSFSRAAGRAGGVLLVDTATAGGAGGSRLEDLLRDLAAEVPKAVFGVRVDVVSGQFREFSDRLAKAAGGREHWVVLSGWKEGQLGSLATRLSCAGRRIWIEIREKDEARQAEDSGAIFHGFLARGSESGGVTGNSSSFFLTQCLARQQRPFLVQGCIGPRAAAACRLAGATGVVLEEQLLLLEEAEAAKPWRALIERIESEDTALAGAELGLRVRLCSRVDHTASRALERVAAELISRDSGGHDASWATAVRDRIGWGDPSSFAWPLGQAVGLAHSTALRHRTVGRALEGYRRTEDETSAALADAMLAKGSPLAVSHGTEFPIVQGPMTRVSDRAEFARRVAAAGALPLVALALMDAAQAGRLLTETRRALDGRPWGAGILGFAPSELLEPQVEAILRERPRFALIAGGRPDQAARLEAAGVTTYLHTPSPALLRIFFEQGARRFVLEGSECGGHTGPLSSFILWEQAVETLLALVPSAEADKVHVLFAGGVHDALSAAMVSAIAAPLAARRMRIGVLIGTAYLFTGEAVESGAIVAGFQQMALACTGTVALETGPGHIIRCAQGAFAREFQVRREQLLRQGLAQAEVAAELDRLALGRARIASKGVRRRANGELEEAPVEAQWNEGMYMMGHAAALRDTVIPARQLHEEISAGSVQLLREWARDTRDRDSSPVQEPVAIVGMSCLLPGAADPETFWRNLLDKRSAIGEIPAHRFDWRLFFDPDPSAADSIYSRWGGFLDEIEFDPLRYGIPPNSLRSISISQLLALEAARRALEDAGYGDGSFDRENTAVILGATTTADLFHYYIARSTFPTFTTDADGRAGERLPVWNEESFPGILTNVAAGRVANRLDLGGPNFTVDAACASSLAAVDLAIRELETGRSSMAIVGGVDLDQTPYSYLAFSKTRALSRRGRATPFCRTADGIVISEGVVVMVLKRLADAERDGDRIYAVIRACEGSSDGKGMGLTAPQPSGQRRALRRAYQRAGFDAGKIGLYEAHGTGTVVGDRAELETIASTLEDAKTAPGQCVLGSAKSLLGHTRAAAGMVGAMKAALALYREVLPPHAGVSEPLEPLSRPGFPLRLLDSAQPWLSCEEPRRAGVSAFGFGGSNFHVVLEEYQGRVRKPAPGASIWPAEMFCFSAADRAGLLERLRRLSSVVTATRGSGAELRLASLAAWACQGAGSAGHRVRLGFVASQSEELAGCLNAGIEVLESPGRQAPPGLYVSLEPPAPGAIGFLFPGQGSQYPGMGIEQALYSSEMRDSFAGSDAGRWLLPGAFFTEEEKQAFAGELAAPDVAQPAIAAVSMGLLDFARRLGLRADRAAGHSFGEYTALYAGGALSREQYQELTRVRGESMRHAADLAKGSMMAVHAPVTEIREVLREFPRVCLANINSPGQGVISGGVEEVETVCEALAMRGIKVSPLRVGSAFHSPLMRPAVAPLNEAIERASISAPCLPVHSNLDGAPYPADPEAIRGRLLTHLERPVDFVAQIRGMYASGVRIFVEIGPRSTLTGLVEAILEGESHLAVSLDGGARGWKGLLTGLARLFAAGVSIDPEELFRGRDADAGAVERFRPPAPSEWLIDGGRIRRRGEERGLIGAEALLTRETRDEIRSTVSQAGLAAEPNRAEALAAYEQYQQTMRRFLEGQEQVLMRLLGHSGEKPVSLAGGMEGSSETLPGQPPTMGSTASGLGADGKAVARGLLRSEASITPVPVAEEPDAGELTDPEGLKDLLVRLIADRTGYPEEMLNLGQDFEAELGLESIKRIEILASLEARLPQPVRSRIQGCMDELTRLKTMRDLVERIRQEWVQGAPAQEASLQAEAPAGQTDAPPPAAMAVRYVVETVPCERGREKTVPEGPVLVTEDELGVSGEVVTRLLGLGIAAVAVPRAAMTSESSLLAALDALERTHGAVWRQGPRTLVHLASLPPAREHESVADWRNDTEIGAKSLLTLMQRMLGSAGAMGRFAVAVTGLGGRWGQNGAVESTGAAAGAGVSGLLSSAAQEFPSLRTLVVDVDTSENPARIAKTILDELLAAATGEIGRREGQRVRCGLREAGFEARRSRDVERDWKPRPGEVVLLTGGARGITARVAVRLAAPGVRLVLAGRGAVAKPGDETLEGLRARLIGEARRQGATLTLREIDRRVRQAGQAWERQRTIEALRRLGAEVEYHAVDVTDPVAFPALIGDLYRRFGALHGVIHGAGLIEDAEFLRKERASFERVFDAKADSTWLLNHSLRPEGLRWVVLFGSVSGRFGNLGQADYAAGNETMGRLAWTLSRRLPSARIVCVHWGPWGGGGMLEGEVGRHLSGRGMQILEPDAALDFLERELAYGKAHEVEVVAGYGPWSAHAHSEEPMALAAPAEG